MQWLRGKKKMQGLTERPDVYDMFMKDLPEWVVQLGTPQS